MVLLCLNTHVCMPVIDDEETLILEEESRSKMSEKAKDPEVIQQKISHKPIDYEKLNRFIDDFGKRFSPQQELSAKQDFWPRISNPSIEPSYTPPVIVDVPSELPKGVENRYMATHVDGVFANGVVMIFEMDIAFYAIQGMEILSFMIRVQILLIILSIFHTHLHNPKRILELAEYINTLSWNRPTIYCDDDDDDDDKDYTIAITPDLPITDSLIMEDEYLDTIPATESDEFIKSSAENLVPTPSESEDASDGECDLPVCDDFPKSHLVTLSNPLFDIDDDCTSSDDESFSEEDIPMENFKFFSNPLFDLDKEIISSEVNLIQNKVLESTTSIPPGIDSFDAESNLIESLLNQNTSIDSSYKIDSLLDEFAGELTLLKSIPPGIDDENLDPEGEIHLVERLLYDNSSPRPLEELNEDDDNSTSLPEFESFHVDYPDSGDSTINVVEDIPIDVPNIFPTHPTLHMDFDFIPSHNDLGSDLDVSSPSGNREQDFRSGDMHWKSILRFLATLSPVIVTLLRFSSKIEDKVFHHGLPGFLKPLVLMVLSLSFTRASNPQLHNLGILYQILSTNVYL
ncbi:hypothetical protein Tco_1079233 [Tanacetum coccineum]|uniref:Uncharacterized protein n=1 Tax=Tanacetum coccineum TaxID=301880 RepID=A0ABQ5HRK5_9ASTR